MKERIKKLADNRIVIGIALFVIAVATAFAASNNPLAVGRIGRDSSVFHYVARVMRQGGMPYLDTFDHKGPLIYLIDAAGLAISKDIGVWIMEVLFLCAAYFFAYKLARLLGCGRIYAVAAVAVCALALRYYFEGGNQVEEYAFALVMISLYVFAKFFLKDSAHWYDLLLCGASFGAVCMLRINMVALWAVMCIGVLISCIRKKQAKKLVPYLAWFLAGAALVILPIVIWLCANGAWSAFIEDYFLFNFKYTSDAERASFRMILQAAEYFIKAMPFILGTIFLLHYAVEKNRMFEWLCVSSLVLTLASMCMSGQSYGHYGMILCPLIFIAFAYALAEISMKTKGKELEIKISDKERKVRVIVVKTVILIALLFLASRNRPKVVTEYETGLEEIAKIITDNTAEADKITVCGNRDCVYLCANRMAASKYSYQDPIASVDSAIKEEFIEDVKKMDAVIIVISTSSSWHKELDGIIAQYYSLAGSVNGTEIYRRK